MGKNNAQAVTANSQEEKVPFKLGFCYGSGDVACNIVFGMITSLLTLFYTDYAGVPVATVGMVMLVSRVFDGSSDVIMGIIVSKTHSRWGKARPWILWMSIPFCVTAVMLFTVPQTTASLQFWYIFLVYNLCTTVSYTAINVPYGTLSTLITKSSHSQDILSVFRMTMSPLGKITGVSFTMPVVKLFGNDQSAWVKAMLLWAIIAFILLLICFIGCKEVREDETPATTTEGQKVGVGTQVKALVTNQYFWSTLVLWTITVVHTTVWGTTLPYYCKYIFLNDDWVYTVLYLCEILTLVVVSMMCPMMLKKFGKKQISLIGACIAVVGHALFMLNSGSFAWAVVTSIIRAAGEAPLIALVFGMMGDAVDFGEWKTGLRQASLIFGAGSMGFKIGQGICSALITRLLSAAGYVSSSSGTVTQPDSAIAMIRTIYCWGPILVWAIAVVVLILYRLDNQYPTIVKELEERNAAKEIEEQE